LEKETMPAIQRRGLPAAACAASAFALPMDARTGDGGAARLDRSALAWRAHDRPCKVAWSPDGGTLATASNRGEATTRASATGARLWLASTGAALQNGIVWSPDG
jgi:hypothetical protein